MRTEQQRGVETVFNCLESTAKVSGNLQSTRPAGIPPPVRADVHFWPLLLLFFLVLSSPPHFWEPVPCFVFALCLLWLKLSGQHSNTNTKFHLPKFAAAMTSKIIKKTNIWGQAKAAVCCLNPPTPLVCVCVHLEPQCHQKQSQGTHPEGQKSQMTNAGDQTHQLCPGSLLCLRRACPCVFQGISFKGREVFSGIIQ